MEQITPMNQQQLLTHPAHGQARRRVVVVAVVFWLWCGFVGDGGSGDDGERGSPDGESGDGGLAPPLASCCAGGGATFLRRSSDMLARPGLAAARGGTGKVPFGRRFLYGA